MIDLVATLLLDSEEKIQKAEESFAADDFPESIYYSYTSFVNTAKALLTGEGTKTNTQAGIIKDFDELFISGGKIDVGVSFTDLVYQINQQEPSREFASYYLEQANIFQQKAAAFRQLQIAE
jgi:sulfite reductase (ferredoxin)